VQGLNLELHAGEVLGLVSESGAGKSRIGNGIVQLLSAPGRITRGDIYLNDDLISALNSGEIRKFRGRRIGFIFQDPVTSLNPLFTVENQLIDAIVNCTDLNKSNAAKKAIELLEKVGIPEPDIRIKQYPHQFSDGMRQRVVIAIALAGNPEMIIADEPTTALDVSVQD
jgi:peptide/nickel transport system ATP-binding protein